MNHTITNCIQKSLIESDNMIIFGTNFRSYFKYICYLDFF